MSRNLEIVAGGGVRRSRGFPRERQGAAFALAILGCVLAFTLYQVTRRAKFKLDLELAVPAACQVSAAYDLGAGFAGPRSAAVALEARAEGQSVSFELPKGTLRAVRIEFAPAAGALRRARIRGERGFLEPLSAVAADGSSVTLQPRQPFDYSRVKAARRLPLILAGDAILIALGMALYALRRLLALLGRAAQRLWERAMAWADPLAQWLSVDGFIRFDAPAIWFYAACLAAFVVGSLANLNGSSVGVFAADYGYAPAPRTLLGMPRGIRADEWAYHTPDILNQALRRERFAFEQTALGGHGIALLGNVPVRHVSTVFRPQFWSFFFLPLDRAFSIYWQFKALLLLAGVFTWLLLITDRTFWSAVGAVWFFFSPFTQWTYSWTSLLPEMVGLACFIVVLVCFLTVGRNPVALAAAALGLAACTVNFVLCGYPPHLIPLFWTMAIFVFCWCAAHRGAIARRAERGRRLLAILAAAAIVAAAGLVLFADLRVAIVAEAHTIYPSQRSLPGGANLSPATVLTHFLQWTEAEHRYPQAMTDICEAAGFLWLAPFTLFWFMRTRLSRAENWLAGGLWCAFLLVGAWAVLPLPAFLGRPFGMDRTFSTRCLPALGLGNVAIVAFYMASRRMAPAVSRGAPTLLLRGLQVLVPFGLLMFAVNRANGRYFSLPELALDVFLGAASILFLLEGRKPALAAILLVPHVLWFGAVNPVQRGLDVVLASPLARFVSGHPALRDGQWLVFGDAPGTAGFVAATGCEVYNGLAYLPDVDRFDLLAAAGLDRNVLNRNGYRTAIPIDAAAPRWVELRGEGFVRWHVSPLDPLLRRIGIRYFAFAEKPPAEVAARLKPLSDGPVGTLWLYGAD